MEYSNAYFYNEKEFCFYLPNSNKKFQYIHENKDKFNITNDIGKTYDVIYENRIYTLESPGNVEFIFPNGEKKLVFISSHRHIEEILSKYIKHDYYYSKDETDNYTYFEVLNFAYIYPVKKIKISNRSFANIYSSNNKVIQNYNNLKPKDLSLSFDKYLKYSQNINKNDDKFFIYSDERKKLYELLDSKMDSHNRSFIPICGPEGIGKTASILAYCKMKSKNYDYFYYNARAFAELINAHKKDEIEELLTNELSRCIVQDKLETLINNIIGTGELKYSPLEFLIHILKNLTNSLKVLIIDQYKTSLDENYKSLKILLEKYNKSFNIILLSSMNEDDVKGSIVKGIKKENKSKDNFYLDYIYIGKLVEVSEIDKKKLKKDEIDVLESLGNLYSIYYEILDFKSKNNNNFKKKNFFDKIKDDICISLQNYYKELQEISIHKSLIEILDIEVSNINKEKFLELYMPLSIFIIV